MKKVFDGPWLVDPKNQKASVSLTLLILSVILSIVLSVLVATGIITVVSFVETIAIPSTWQMLYFGRKWTEKPEALDKQKKNEEEAE